MGVFDDSIATFLTPIASYLSDDQVSEVLVNGPHEIFIEKDGNLEKAPVQFKDEQALQAAVVNIAQYVGRRIDSKNPVLDARLPDGSRIAAVFPPCSRKGTTLSIRKFQKNSATFMDLVQKGTLSKDAARFLDIAVFLQRNLLISGGTGSGKTTLLNILASRIPPQQRMIVIEDATELKIQSAHVVSFETQHPDPQGKGEVTIRDLLRAALRLRPDRIIVGEVRGAEALDLVTAMNTGHGGSMGTIHANSPVDALVRLETLALMAGTQIPPSAIRRQISSAIQLMVQIDRMSDGTRKVREISEVHSLPDENGQYRLTPIYRFEQKALGQDGKVLGELVPTGTLPSFMNQIELYRIPFPKEKFSQAA